MKFGKLIEYNIRNTFLEKPQGKYGVGKIQCGETSSRLFSNISGFNAVCFYCMSKSRTAKIY